MSDAPLIEASHLACSRGGRILFEDLSFALHAGEALLLVGPNGSGKSSLLRMLAGFLPIAGGSLQLEGRAVEPAGLSTSLVYVGHANPLKPVLSVDDNITFLRALANGGPDADMAQSFGLAEIKNMPARYLSSGQKRRTSLAALLHYERKIWLLDEPGVGLDRDFRRRLEDVVRRHRQRGGVVISASHGDVTLDDPFVLDFAGAMA